MSRELEAETWSKGRKPLPRGMMYLEEQPSGNVSVDVATLFGQPTAGNRVVILGFRSELFSRIPAIKKELLDAWEGSGQRKRVTFQMWLKNMAADRQGTLRDAALEYLAHLVKLKEAKRRG